MCICLLGNEMLLRYDSSWDKLLNHYKDKKCIVKDSEFPLCRPG